MSTEPRDVTIIGAGVVGVACARLLQADGHRIRVLDPQPPASACSYGNAGVFAYDSVEPLATPGTLASVPGILLRGGAGISVRWRYLPQLLPWLARFVAAARPRQVAAGTRALTALCAAAGDGTDALVAGSRAADYVHATGWLHVCETRAGLEAAATQARTHQQYGVNSEMVGPERLRELLPEIGRHVLGGLHSPDCAMCTDPAGFVRALAADVEAAGGEFLHERVHRLRSGPDSVTLETDSGNLRCEHAVVACGIDSRELTRQLGERFPLETERGYHVMFPDAGIRPAMPVMASEHKFVTTPMNDGLRMAGLTELGGTGLPPTPKRLRVMVELGQRLFPGLHTADRTEWMGFRPTLPDSLPVIGRSPSWPRVSYAFGHQHLGLTLAGLTGRLVADEIAGRTPPVDMTPLRPERWLAVRRAAAAGT